MCVERTRTDADGNEVTEIWVRRNPWREGPPPMPLTRLLRRLAGLIHVR